MKLDDKGAVLYELYEMQAAGSRAHGVASEEGGKTGLLRDMLFGINTMIDAVVALVEED